MPIQLTINVTSDLDHLPTKADFGFLDRAVRDAAEYVRGVWGSAVQGTILPGMSAAVNDDLYYRSLGQPGALRRVADLSWQITSDYGAAERIEMGVGSYDMKPGLLAGPNSRVGKDGRRYNTVPFRFGTPQASGAPRPNFPGDQTMPKEVYDVVKTGATYPESNEGQRTKIPWLTEAATGDIIGGINFEAEARGMPAPMQLAYTWKTGLFSGMKKGGPMGHSQYNTFRRVSEPGVAAVRSRRADGKLVVVATGKGSSPDSWIHPGRAANPLIQAVRDYCAPHVEAHLLAVAQGRNTGP